VVVHSIDVPSFLSSIHVHRPRWRGLDVGWNWVTAHASATAALHSADSAYGPGGRFIKTVRSRARKRPSNADSATTRAAGN
jgi:hypothetical protein